MELLKNIISDILARLQPRARAKRLVLDFIDIAVEETKEEVEASDMAADVKAQTLSGIVLIEDRIVRLINEKL